MSFILGKKLDSNQKREYELEIGSKTTYNLRFVSFVVLILSILFLFIDYLIIDDGIAYRNLNFIRFIFIVLFALPFSIYFYNNKNNPPQYLLIINALGYSLYIFALSVAAGSNQQAIIHNTVALLMVNSALYILFGLKLKNSIIISLIILIAVNYNYSKIGISQYADYSRLYVNIWFFIITSLFFLLGLHLNKINKKAFLIQYQLKQANQSKYKLFSIVSHDLKNIISSQTTITDYLKHTQDSLTNEERSKMLNLLHNSSTDALIIFEDLMAWIKTQMEIIKPNISDIKFDSFIQNQIEPFLPIAENKNITIDVENYDLDKIQSDATILSLVFRNILGNAIKYSNYGSQIKIKGNKQQYGFQLQITDFGMGISKNKLADLFEFDKLSSTSGTNGEKGTGMGLVLSKELLAHINGTINIESKEGKGTSVFINVPEFNHSLN